MYWYMYYFASLFGWVTIVNLSHFPFGDVYNSWKRMHKFSQSPRQSLSFHNPEEHIDFIPMDHYVYGLS